MNARELALLEKAFVAEIDGAMNPQHPGIMQTRAAKLADKLVQEGYLARRTVTLGVRLPMRVEGYELTHAGRLAYCLTCDEEEPGAC